MAFVGFGGFNQAEQARLLQQQIRDQQEAQRIMAQIGLEQRQHQQMMQRPSPTQNYRLSTPVQNPTVRQPANYSPQRSTGMNVLQMQMFMTSLMSLMTSMMQLGNGFSSFLGGGTYQPQQQQPQLRPFSDLINA